MKEWPEIDYCNNCNEIYTVPTDSEGMLLVDGEGAYLCDRCRVNPNVKMEDYKKKVKCVNEDCVNQIWILKKSNNASPCLYCCLKMKKDK
jgi:hypothetical protein